MTETKSKTTDPAQSTGVLVLSMGGQAYKSLSLMSQYDMEMVKQLIQFFQLQAQAQSTMAQNYLSTSEDAAKASSDAIKDDANTSLVGGLTGLAGVGLTAYAYVKTSDPATENELKNAQSLQKELNNRPANQQIEMRNINEEKTPQEMAIDQKVKDWASGDKSKLVGFNKADPITQKALEQAKGSEQYDTICKNVSEHISALEAKINHNSQQFGTWSNIGNQVTSTVEKFGTMATNTDKANDSQEGQIKQAQATVIDSAQKQWSQNQSNTQQSMSQFQQDAWATAGAFAQMHPV